MGCGSAGLVGFVKAAVILGFVWLFGLVGLAESN